jgi:isoquinoline 1-oxidoreductase subunit beta
MTMHLDTATISRRNFIGVSAAAAGGLVLGIDLPVTARSASAASTNAKLTAWIAVGTDQTVTIQVGSAEMGQGILTSLPQIVAEELMVDWNKVISKTAPPDAAYANPLFHSQLTAGSSSVRGYFDVLLKAGATAREMLVTAAASKLGVSPSLCVAAHGVVSVPSTGASITYGEVAADAALLTPPANPTILSASRGYQIVGKAIKRVDIPAKVNGSAKFGIDARVPGMVYAAIKHCPTLGGTVASVPPAPAGVLAVVNLGNAVGVVANDTYAAFRAARALSVSWNVPAASKNMDTSIIKSQAKTLMSSGKAAVAEVVGRPEAALAKAAKVVSHSYGVPYLPHACMEPLSCTVDLRAKSCAVHVPTQAPDAVQATVAAMTGLAPAAVTVTSLFMGGGLGRKFEVDYIKQAVKIAQAVGKPVKLTWSREEDFGNDQYRPMALVQVTNGLDAGGSVTASINRIVSPSILYQRGWIPDGVADSQCTEGCTELAYGFGSRKTEYVRHPAAIPVGFWRSVGHSINAFAVESAIDEAAKAAGKNPYAFRRKLLAGNPRALAVLDAAATLGGWSSALPAGHARGIAYAEAFGSLTAQVIEIARVSSATASPVMVKVVKVAVAVDCGMVVNPQIARAQVEGGVIHGLNAAQWGQLNFDQGKIQQRNFDDFKMMRLRDAPKISVTFVNSPGKALGGIGEVGVPAAAPALANAYASLTGLRKRDLPLRISTATSGGD